MTNEIKNTNISGAAVEDSQEEKIKALTQERDQLKVNLYLLATNLKELGFQISDQANTIQRLGTDIMARMRLTPQQMHMIQRQIAGNQPQQDPQT